MKFVVQAVLGLSFVLANPASAAATAPAGQAEASGAAHVKAVQDLLGAMQIEKVLRGVASRARYSNDAQRKAILAKVDGTPSAVVCQRMAAPLAQVISASTATEMTRFYNTPYGKQVIHDKYNSHAQIIIPGMRAAVPPEEQKARRRAAYVQASKELADAEPAIEHEAFKLVQQIDKEKR